jgi:tetratricopeptide (TPR) repeat protein
MGLARHTSRRPRACCGLAWALFGALLAPSARADVPRDLEPDYAEAVLSFNSRDFSKALKLLDALIRRDPRVNEFLELKALSLKVSQKDQAAEKIYQQLIENKKRQGRDPVELAPYHFELAMILSRRNLHDQAKPYFAYAVQHGFNLAPSHLYLGMTDFNSGKWSEASEHFRGVLSEGAADLAPIAHFYLGQTYLKMGYSSGGTSSLLEARGSARTLLDDSKTDADTRAMAQRIFGATEAVLAPYGSGQFFGYLGLLSGYDSNILLIPGTISNAGEMSGKSTAKETFMGAVGYATSSLGFLQFVPSVRTSLNFNLNRDSKSSEFVSTTASLYVNRGPLSRFSYGLKLEGSPVFRNDVDPATNAGTYRLFSISGSLGPYFRYQVARQWQVGVEGTLEPRRYENDADNDQRRSGTGGQLRAYIQNEQGSRFWNPTLFLELSDDGAEGSEYDSSGISASLSDAMHLGSRLDLTATVSLEREKYPRRTAGERRDTTSSFQANLSWRWAPKWTVLGNASFTKNASNFDSVYGYDRLELGGGVTYSF